SDASGFGVLMKITLDKFKAEIAKAMSGTDNSYFTLTYFEARDNGRLRVFDLMYYADRKGCTIGESVLTTLGANKPIGCIGSINAVYVHGNLGAEQGEPVSAMAAFAKKHNLTGVVKFGE